MKKEKIHIDKISIKIEVNHDPKKISSCYQIYSNEKYSFENAVISYKAKNVSSEFDSVIKIQSFCTKDETSTGLKLSGNLYKFLYGHNVTGSSDITDLILKTVDKLKQMNLVHPTEKQLEAIRLGQFRIHSIDIKRDLVFESKQNALQYFSHLKKNATYTHKEKAMFENGIYFGLGSKRWHICNYYKGREVEVNAKKSKTSKELKALADLMIRQEIRIHSKQLSTWDLRFGHQWFDLKSIDTFFSNLLEKTRISKIELKDSNSSITDKSDRKFYNCVINGDYVDIFSKSTINRKRKKFLEEYNIDIKSL